MVESLRTETETKESLAARLEQILAVETERVANAAALAELLGPMIQQSLQSAAAQITLASPAPETASPKLPVVDDTATTPRISPANIADFIDEMIAQERPRDRVGQSVRRAS